MESELSCNGLVTDQSPLDDLAARHDPIPPPKSRIGPPYQITRRWPGHIVGMSVEKSDNVRLTDIVNLANDLLEASRVHQEVVAWILVAVGDVENILVIDDESTDLFIRCQTSCGEKIYDLFVQRLCVPDPFSSTTISGNQLVTMLGVRRVHCLHVRYSISVVLVEAVRFHPCRIVRSGRLG